MTRKCQAELEIVSLNDHAKPAAQYKQSTTVDSANGKCCQTRHYPLTHYDALPHHLRGNRWVQSGYRVNYSVVQCIHSAFQLNNELANIWTHVFGFLLFTILLLYHVCYVLPSLNAQWSDYIVLAITIATFNYTMLCSVGFHVFNSHSPRCYSAWLAIDISGITIGALGFYLSGVFYAFYCFHIIRAVYVALVGVMCAVTLLVQVLDAVQDTHRTLRRVALFGILGVMAAVPVAHWIILENGLSPTVRTFLPKVGVTYFILFLAVLAYLSKFPERWWPGKFDLLGHSHNLWHILSVVAFTWWHFAGIQFLRYRLAQTCPSAAH